MWFKYDNTWKPAGGSEMMEMDRDDQLKLLQD